MNGASAYFSLYDGSRISISVQLNFDIIAQPSHRLFGLKTTQYATRKFRSWKINPEIVKGLNSCATLTTKTQFELVNSSVGSHMPRYKSKIYQNSKATFSNFRTCTCSWKRIGNSCAIVSAFFQRQPSVLVCLCTQLVSLFHQNLRYSPSPYELWARGLRSRIPKIKSSSGSSKERQTHVIYLLFNDQSGTSE